MAYGIFGALLIVELEQQRERSEMRIRQRTLRDASDPFALPDATFVTLFRFKKEVAREIINMIIIHLDVAKRATAIPNYLKILTALYFYGHGSYQINIGQGYSLGLSQPSVSRAIEQVTNIIYQHLLTSWIEYPKQNVRKLAIKNGFLNKFNLPRCLGAIDCTHIAIIAPPENHPIHPAHPYYCRKGYYSINCQIICDSDLNILSMNARFPGSTHDSAIWQLSTIKRYHEEQYIEGDNSFIIGDSGYPLQPFLLVPFENPADNSPESNFNHNFIRARNTIERVNGLLKSRFRCLLRHRTLNYDPVKAGKIIYCCGVLHNIAQFYNDKLDLIENIEVDLNQNEADDLNPNQPNRNWFNLGVQVRNEIVETYFNN